jgi:hypothetical protein
VARGAGPNGTGDGVMVTGFLVTMIVTARRPLLVKLPVPRVTVKVVDAVVKLEWEVVWYELMRNTGLGNKHAELEKLHQLNFHVIVTTDVSDY